MACCKSSACWRGTPSAYTIAQFRAILMNAANQELLDFVLLLFKLVHELCDARHSALQRRVHVRIIGAQRRRRPRTAVTVDAAIVFVAVVAVAVAVVVG